MPSDDVQLLLATRRGDQNAARSLWHLHAPRLTAYARSIIRVRGDMHDAEDVVQGVFCRVMNLPEREVKEVRDAAAWLAQITRRTALNWLRGHRRDLARRDRLASDSQGSRSSTGRDRGQAAADDELAAAIGLLPGRLREVIVLKHVGGLTFDQIELATGINRNTAAARYRSALTMLRRSLSADATDHPFPPTTTAAPHPRQNLVHHA